jgi:hydroxymethylpyrimidine pyrophosphatase-like HAD family hydrolase
LLDSQHQLQPTNPNFTVLRRIRTEYPQLPIILSTGKQWTSTAKQRDDLDLHPFYACHLNGNVIYRPGGEVLYQGGLELPTVLDVYDRMQRDGMSLFLYDNERVYHVLPFKTGEADYWSKKLRGYGERVTELAEAEEVMRKVRAGEIKVVKMAVCVEENAVPGTSYLLVFIE